MPNNLPRENSFRLGRECSFRGAGLLRESALLLGEGSGTPEPPVTSAVIPQLVEDLTAHLRDMRQREDVPVPGAPPSTEEEKTLWSDTERARVEDLVLRVRKCMARVKCIIFPPETVEGSSSGGGGGGGGGSAAHNVAVPGSSGDMGGVGRIECLVRELIARDTWPYLLLHFTDLLFETRKAVSSVFVYYLRLDTGKGGVEDLGFKAYLCRHKNIVAQLVTCYDHETSALPAGSMLRELIKHCPVMHRALLVNDLEGGLSDSFEQLHAHLSNAQFEIASDAFDTFQTLLTCDKATVKAAISPDSPEEGAAARFEGFIKKFNELISQMDNYVLKRNSLKLLSEFILDREYFSIMMAYVAEVENLKVVMSALRVAAPNIQFEAFHVFKVFVANPQKTPKIAAILTANKAKLIKFLEDFQNDKEDEQLKEEKLVLIDSLMALEDVPPTPREAAPAPGGGGGGAAE